MQSLLDADHRRVYPDAMVLNAGPDLQQKIDAIPEVMPNVRYLTIQSPDYYDESKHFSLSVQMPSLEKLQLLDVAFQTITLTTDLTPKVKELFMRNIPDQSRITIHLPELESFQMQYYGPPDDDSWVQNMLNTSKKLKVFDTYKFRVGPELTFAGNDLEKIDLHRAELLDSLTIYAPNLHTLRLQACYNMMGTLTIQESHPAFEPVRSSVQLCVNTLNACISPAIAQTLRNNPRIIWEDEGEASNPMEAQFASMHGGAMSMGF